MMAILESKINPPEYDNKSIIEIYFDKLGIISPINDGSKVTITFYRYNQPNGRLS